MSHGTLLPRMTHADPEDGLSRRQLVALQHLAGGLGIVEAAAQARISRRTLSRWMGLERFTEALRRRQLTMLHGTCTALQAASRQAVDVLVGIMEDRSAPAGARTQAASRVLDLALKSLEVDAEARIEKLEAILEGIMNDADRP